MYTPMTSRASKYLESYETPGYGSNVQPGSGATSKAPEEKSQIGRSPYWSPAPPSGGGSYKRGVSASTTSTKTIRKGTAPEMPELPTFKAPEMNKRAMKAATQKLAAPGVRTLRETMQQAMGKNYENPNVRKMTLREALQGYGTGLEKVMSGAQREARSNQMAELDLQRQEQMANFEAQTKMAMQSYQNAWADYLKGSETIQATTPGAENADTGGVKMGNKTYYKSRSPFTGAIQNI